MQIQLQPSDIVRPTLSHSATHSLKTPALQDGKMPLFMGIVQPVLTEGSLQVEPRSGHVGRVHPQVAQMIWNVFGRAEVDLFASEDNSHCPVYFLRGKRCSVLRVAQQLPVSLPYDCPAPSGHQMSQRSWMFCLPGGLTLEEPDMVPKVNSAAVGSPLANSIEEGPPLPSERHYLASPA